MQHYGVFLILFVGVSASKILDAVSVRNKTLETKSLDAAVFQNQTFEIDSYTSLRERLFKNGPCELYEFRCSNDECINRSFRCNNRYDCNDRSDEMSCNVNPYDDCSRTLPFFHCGAARDYDKCIPQAWVCDGVVDCRLGTDELNCSLEYLITKPLRNVQLPKHAAVKWLLDSRKNTTMLKWSDQVHRIAVALHLANANLSDSVKSELAYEVGLQLLSRLALKPIKYVSSAEIAQYVNAFLAVCIDPRKFFGQDLVAELRQRVNKQNYTNPFLLLSLCNAGEDIVEKDVQKLHAAFNSKHKDFWTDIQAYTVMALACAAKQPKAAYDIQKIGGLTMELKNKQLKNGTVENMKTTALVMQALFAAEKEDEENFDEEKAMRQILSKQLQNGSFGSVVNTYYVLPLLNHKSLVNISFAHCPKQEEDEEMALKELIDQAGDKWYVQFSLFIGDQKDLQRTIKLRVPTNASFYRVMEIAAHLDSRFRFEVNMKDGKPYVYSLSNIQDDPENERFWFPYIIVRSNNTPALIPIQNSPVDVIPSSNQHVVYWYKTGTWS